MKRLSLALLSVLLASTILLCGCSDESAGLKYVSAAREIYDAAYTYADGNKSRFPDNIGILVATGRIPVDIVLIPSSGISIPSDFDGWEVAKKANWVAANSSYIMLPNQKQSIMSEHVSVFADPALMSGDEVPVAHNDGASTTISRQELEAKLAEQFPDVTIEQIVQTSREWTME